MIYEIDFTDTAKSDVILLKRSEPQTYRKLLKLLEELILHPTTGTGHPKPLGNNRAGQWSHRITDKHRLIYQVQEKEIIVLVLSTYGHYDDK